MNKRKYFFLLLRPPPPQKRWFSRKVSQRQSVGRRDPPCGGHTLWPPGAGSCRCPAEESSWPRLWPQLLPVFTQRWLDRKTCCQVSTQCMITQQKMSPIHSFSWFWKVNLLPHFRVLHPPSGRVLEVSTSQPGVQFYTANVLDGSIRGKGGVTYGKHSAFCLETQNWPNAVNQVYGWVENHFQWLNLGTYSRTLITVTFSFVFYSLFAAILGKVKNSSILIYEINILRYVDFNGTNQYYYLFIVINQSYYCYLGQQLMIHFSNQLFWQFKQSWLKNWHLLQIFLFNHLSLFLLHNIRNTLKTKIR